MIQDRSITSSIKPSSIKPNYDDQFLFSHAFYAMSEPKIILLVLPIKIKTNSQSQFVEKMELLKN